MVQRLSGSTMIVDTSQSFSAFWTLRFRKASQNKAAPPAQGLLLTGSIILEQLTCGQSGEKPDQGVSQCARNRKTPDVRQRMTDRNVHVHHHVHNRVTVDVKGPPKNMGNQASQDRQRYTQHRTHQFNLGMLSSTIAGRQTTMYCQTTIKFSPRTPGIAAREVLVGCTRSDGIGSLRQSVKKDIF
jgi:hypothetical protein